MYQLCGFCHFQPSQRTSILEEVMGRSDLCASIYAMYPAFSFVIPEDPMSPLGYPGSANAYRHEIYPQPSSLAQEQHKDLQPLAEAEAP
jgi:hypothetical protein